MELILLKCNEFPLIFMHVHVENMFVWNLFVSVQIIVKTDIFTIALYWFTTGLPENNIQTFDVQRNNLIPWNIQMKTKSNDTNISCGA